MKNSNEKQRHLNTIGNNIRRIRQERKMSQEELAKMCGHTTGSARSWVSKIEKGINDPPASELKAIAKALGVTCIELMKEKDEEDQRQKACELFQKCYGKDAFKLVKYFLELNTDGQKFLLDQAETLTTMEKYISKKKESSENVAM